MAGAGYRTWTAGEVVTASNVQSFLQDQTVGVYAGTAARASAILSPSEGQVSYRTDDDVVEVYNGTGWVPVAPADTAGLVHIKTVTSTAVAAIDVTSCFSADYNRYYLSFDLLGGSGELRFRFLNNTTPHTTGNHRVQQLYAASTSVQAFRSTTYTYWSIGQVTSTNRQFSQLILINPFEVRIPSGVSQYLEEVGGNMTLISYGNACDTTTSFNGCQIFAATGNIEGSISVYGYKV
jgi:hypothetical protein